jgi:hypothetical protein
MLFLHRLNYHVFDRNYVEDDIVSQYLLFHRLHGAGGKEFAIEPILVVKTDADRVPYHAVLLKDLMDASMIVMEKIVEVCFRSKIRLGEHER